MKTYSRVLAIAGSDSGGGAGIQADIKAISATGSFAATAITAVTVQNTLGVQEVFPVPAEIISSQIKAVLSDIGADAVKIGMLHNRECVRCVYESLEQNNRTARIVLDPVMVSTSGHTLMRTDAVEELIDRLIPISTLITPNIPEAQILSGEKIGSADDMKRVARMLSCAARTSVLVKGGHLAGSTSVDVLYDAVSDSFIKFESVRVQTPNTHGTGCTLSSAIASYLAQGRSLADAVGLAKRYLSLAIESGAGYSIGGGHGPVNHFFNLNCG